MKFIKLIWVLLIAGGLYAQTPVFNTGKDTLRLSDATEGSGQLILFNMPWDGASSLFVTGDSVDGTTPTVTVKYVLYYGIAYGGTDSLWSEKFTLGTVAASLLKETLGDGNLTGETFDVANDSEWKEALGVRFYFVGSGTHETDVLSVYKIGK